VTVEGEVRVEDRFQLDGMNGMGLAGVELHGVVGLQSARQYHASVRLHRDRSCSALPGLRAAGAGADRRRQDRGRGPRGGSGR